MRHYLPVVLAAILPSCGEASSVKPDDRAIVSASPSARTSGGLVVETPSATPDEKFQRPPIRISLRDERIALHATKLDVELIDARGWLSAAEWGLRLHPQRDGMFVTLGGNIARLEGNVLKFIHQLPGWDETHDILEISGGFPGLAHARVYEDMGKNAPFSRQPSYEKSTGSYFWTGKDWSYSREVSMPPYLVPWSPKALLGLEKGVLRRVAWPKDAPTEDDGRPLPVQKKPQGKCAGAATEVSGMALDSLPTGELFVVGERCDGGAALEYWKAGSSESVVFALPEAHSGVKSAYVSAAKTDAAFIVLSTGEKIYVAHWNGVGLQKLELDLEGHVDALHTAADGTLFFTMRPRSNPSKSSLLTLVRIRPNGELSRSAGFTAGYDRSLWARDAETAFVESGHASILSTQPGLTFENKAWPSILSWRPGEQMLPKFEPSCTTPFVFLYDVATDAPPNFAFPKTVVALSKFAKVKEISVIEFVIGNRRRLGVSVPSAALADELIAHVKETMPDERPVLVCYVPKDDVRKVPIPRATPPK